MLPLTALYGALLVLLFLSLSVNVIRGRRAKGVSLGHGGDALLERRVRAHGNFAEYAPLGILMLGLIEGLGAAALVVHFVGISLVLGRVLHAFALNNPNPQPRARVAGMAMTMTALGIGALAAMGYAAVTWL